MVLEVKMALSIKTGPALKKNEFRATLLSWFLSALLSLPIPVLVILLMKFFPSLKATFDYDRYSPMIYRIPIHWFAGFPHMLVFLPSMVYWGLGLILSLRIYNQEKQRRLIVAPSLLTFSLAALFFILPLLSGVFCLAQLRGITSPLSWEKWEGAHGPWRNFPFLSNTLKTIFILPFVGFISSLLSFILKPNRYIGIICLSCLLGGYFLFYSLYWLID